MSKIFAQSRVLGYVTNSVPLVTRFIKRRKENLIVTSTGKSFHTYGTSHLTLLSVSGESEDDITCLAGDTFHVYSACGKNIYAWRRGNEIKHVYKGHQSNVNALLPFGTILISIDEDSQLKVWDIKTEEELLHLVFSNELFKITSIVHPSTYANKILLGSEQGPLQLWNVKLAKMIYAFKGWKIAVSVLEQAPAIDVVAIGLADGKIILHNLQFDETLFMLYQDWGFVTNISFRFDQDNSKTPIMASGSTEGHITLWDLEKRQVHSHIMNAHYGSVTGLQFLPNEQLLVSSSPDNSLKIWIFDLADGAGRLLRLREGHAQPPTFSRFYGNDGRNILTAGEDSSLRIYSTVTESFNKSLGRASWNRKASKRKGKILDDPMIMRPIIRFDTEMTREKDWDNVVAAHAGLGVVTTWSYDKLKMGEHKLLLESLKSDYNVVATSLCMTHCGNFVIIGYSTGQVERFNIQSGIHRASYGSNRAHKGSVKGIAVDSLNQTVMTLGRDGYAKFWMFKQKKGSNCLEKIKLDEPVEWIRTHRESSLVAICLEDFSVVLMDMDTRRVVRQFEGHQGRITDATFSPDCRWLLTSSMDCTIRTWDVPSGQMVDIFKVKEACNNLDFSPTGEFLMTSHICNLGLYLWSNRTIFTHVSLKAIDPDAKISTISLPSSAPESKDIEILNEEESQPEEEENASVDQIENLLTLTTLASSRWLNLLDIDIVKRKNKPKNPPKKPANAPFFLPTIPSLEFKFDFSDIQTDPQSEKMLIHPDFQNLSVLGKLIKLSAESGQFSEAVEKMKSFSPNTVDLEIQSLDMGFEAEELMLQFLKMVKFMFESRKDFELSQSYLGLFLKKHGPTVVKNKTLRNYLGEIKKAQSESWVLLREKLFYNLSAVQHLKTM